VTPTGGSSILVVGGAGFVGGNLVREALARGADRIVVVDNLLSSERSNIPEDDRVSFVEGSIADDGVLADIEDEFELVFHLATYHGNQSSIADPIADHENNLITTLKLYEHLTGFSRLRKLVYAASGCTLAPHTHGEAEATPEEGAVPLDLDSPYQISKVVGEFYSVYFHNRHGLPTVRARFQNVYGPGEILGAGRWRGTPATVWRNVTPTFIYRALKGLSLELDDEGNASRDFIYVSDIVAGLFACADRGEPGDVYNLASGVETTIRDLAESIVELTGSTSRIELRPAREWDRSGHRYGSPEKAKRELGFEASTSLEEGLQQTIDWMRDHLGLIESCIERHASRLRDSVPSVAA
jgi:nucleoside-diphosphate-sugar epimerase